MLATRCIWSRPGSAGDLQEFCRFIGITAPEQFRAVTRAHVLAGDSNSSSAACPDKLTALASLFGHMLEHHAMNQKNAPNDVGANMTVNSPQPLDITHSRANYVHFHSA